MNAAQNDAIRSLLESTGPALIAFVTLAMVGMVLLTGYSMKFSLAASGVGRFSFWKSLGISTVASLAVGFVSCSMAVAMLFLDGQSPAVLLISGFLSVTTFAFVIARFGRCGIGRGYLAYFFNGVFGAIGAVLLALGLTGAFLVARPYLQINDDDLAKLREAFPRQPTAGLDFAGSNLTGSNLSGFGEAPFDLVKENASLALPSLRNVSRTQPGLLSDELSGGLSGELGGNVTDELTAALSGSNDNRRAPVKSARSSNDSIQNAFFESGRQPQESPTEPSRELPGQGTSKAFEPPRNRVQTNPFVQ